MAFTGNRNEWRFKDFDRCVWFGLYKHFYQWIGLMPQKHRPRTSKLSVDLEQILFALYADYVLLW